MHTADIDDSLTAAEMVEEIDVALVDQAASNTLEDIAPDPEPPARFEDLGLSAIILNAVRDLHYTTPTPVQAAAIPSVLAGRDLLAAAQTGTGKTAAFLLPAMNNLGHVQQRGRGRRAAAGRGPRMLVITPTRELAQQIDDVCTHIAARSQHIAVTVVGGVSYNPQKSALRRGCDILVATPGRLIDLIEQGSCDLNEVEVLAIDEADRMLDMGFLPSVKRIVDLTPASRQTLLFSATLDKKTMDSVGDLVRDPVRVEIAPATSTAETVDQFVLPVSFDSKNDALAQILKNEGASRVIVFMRTKHRADACCRRLTRAGISATAIHGDRSQAQRERALKAFRAGNIDVLVATDVLARGIDITDVRYVVNFDVPGEPIDYIHRIGRTGRAGEIGWALTFVTKQDISEFFDIEALMGRTAALYDAAGIEVGDNAPVLDPDRVPAARGARRRSGRGGSSRSSGRSSGTRRDGGGDRSARRRRREPAAAGSRRAAGNGSSDRADGSSSSAPRPARPKRAGSARVHGETRDRPAAPAGDIDRAHADRRRSDGSDARTRARREPTRGARADRGGAAPVAHDWRNRDLPEERRGRGARSAGPNRGARAGSGRSERSARAQHGRGAEGSSRRPGDQGGRH